MEQKQIDELEDSYTGEEFIDEEDLEQLQVEKKPGAKLKRGRPSKIVKSTVNKSTVNKKAGDILEEVKVTQLKEEQEHRSKKEDNLKRKEEKQKEDNLNSKEEPKFEEGSPAYDPWEDDDEPAGGGFFWKVLTGILVILLVVSVFTQGFNFGGGESVTGAAALSISEAENKAMDYVNNNLLQPPFVAELENSADLGSLYQVTLSVAGQRVKSYITKDGKLFFPQGFDTSVDFSAEPKTVGSEADIETESPASNQETAAEPEASAVNQSLETEETAETAAAEPEPILPAEETKEFTLNAKRWLFNPNELEVNQGDTVKLTIVPSDLVFTFALPEFGVEKEISGPTLVEFTADKAGKFEFECASCEDWRGMIGVLVVK